MTELQQLEMQESYLREGLDEIELQIRLDWFRTSKTFRLIDINHAIQDVLRDIETETNAILERAKR